MDQAAVKQGEEQLRLYQDAVAAQLKADSASTAADRVDATLAGLKGQQALLLQKNDLAKQAEKDTQGQVAAANERNAGLDKARAVVLGQGKPRPSPAAPLW